MSNRDQRKPLFMGIELLYILVTTAAHAEVCSSERYVNGCVILLLCLIFGFHKINEIISGIEIKNGAHPARI